jgi:hypothetical protein
MAMVAQFFKGYVSLEIMLEVMRLEVMRREVTRWEVTRLEVTQLELTWLDVTQLEVTRQGKLQRTLLLSAGFYFQPLNNDS